MVIAVILGVVFLAVIVYGLLNSPARCSCRIVNGHPFVYDQRQCPVHGDNSNSAMQ
jgi:hypothetical protein